MTRKSSSVTIRDVASQANVSVATVSRYINQTAPVSEDVAERIQAVMNSLRYTPHVAARNLATNRANAIGLMVSFNMYGDFFGPMLNGIESVVGEDGLSLLISSNNLALRGGQRGVPLGPNNTDGLIVYADSLDEQEVRHLYELQFPMVMVYRTPPEGLKIPCVNIENKAASFKIVEHLIKVHNRRRIIFLRGPEGQQDSYWRELGYLKALEENGIACDPLLILPGEFERHIAAMTITDAILNGLEFDAVFAGDDDAAVGVLGALRDAGKRVPQDVSVVGFDDQRTSSYLTPALTTVRAPTLEVGRVAAQQLINLLRNGQADCETLLPTEIVIRESCGCNASR
ncbi:MAG: LacI family DNA-binding transcriptional regulator [Anaerolineales bacterium]|jgi:DNA-binding LacI/PurR family transcriptional regulator|nr:LacI family DNA-binding transcriptional regulator [Anaerolineales bacterium]